MPERRALNLDLAAGGLLLSGLVVGLCLLSHDPGRPAPEMIYPSTPAADNLLGPPGAWLAQTIHETLGLAMVPILAGWFVLVLLLFLRRRWLAWSLRLTGWVLLVPGVAVAADLGTPTGLGPALPGEGGWLGAWLGGVLREEFSPATRGALLGAWLFLAVVCAFDFVVVRLTRGAGFCWRRLARARDARAARLAEQRLVMPRLLRRAPARTGKKLVPEGAEESSSIPINRPEPSPEIEAEEADEPKPTKPPHIHRPVPIHRPVAVVSEPERFADYELPALSLLEEPAPFPYEEHDKRLREQAVLLEQTFIDFGLNVRVVGINTGPVITQYEVSLETGLRVNKVTSLADDLALNLKVPSVRIVAPIPGKNTVGIEVPNEHRAIVRLKEVIVLAGKRIAKAKVPLFLGKDTEGQPLVYDLAEMPHLLIAGRTGTGKSVCMNAVILSILMTRRPDEVKMVMIDPKMLELSEYGRIPHLMHPVVKDMKKAEAILAWAVDKMEERYDLLSRARVRGIAGYNELTYEEILRRVQPADDEDRANIPERMPYIVIFVDEMNDLMMTMKREVEGHIIRLAQKSRAAGIHLVVATQKPTVDVITGLIKSNLPARICFQVSSRTDSRVVLDEMGGEKLLGKGDMLFLQPGTSTLVRSQGTYASDQEISKVVEALECEEPCYAPELVQLKTNGEGKGGFLETLRARDEMYEAAVEVVVREGRGSVSLLQRTLGIGYGRAARLIDFMAEDSIVGSYNGSSAREVLYTPEQWDEVKSAACGV